MTSLISGNHLKYLPPDAKKLQIYSRKDGNSIAPPVQRKTVNIRSLESIKEVEEESSQGQKYVRLIHFQFRLSSEKGTLLQSASLKREGGPLWQNFMGDSSISKLKSEASQPEGQG